MRLGGKLPSCSLSSAVECRRGVRPCRGGMCDCLPVELAKRYKGVEGRDRVGFPKDPVFAVGMSSKVTSPKMSGLPEG